METLQTKAAKPEKKRGKLKAKHIVLIVLAVALIVMLIPKKLVFKDGGTKVYQAVLYRVTDYHRFSEDPATGKAGLIVGKEVKILGMTVFDNSHFEAADRD